jgi:NAD(P)-dependent dehydrogenase (short-subunit alcohol dehydrogenase family)
VSVAVVTGASRGIGQGIATALGAAGFDVVVGYRVDDTGAKETAARIEAAGREASIVSGDVTNAGTMKALGDAATELGSLAVWVNNAGVSTLAPVVDTADDDVRRMLDVNVVGTFLGLREAAARFRAQSSGGRIVNVASELGVRAFPYLGVYSATKFAVVGLTQAAALELAAEDVTVNAVCPGTTETEMVAAERRAEAGLAGSTLDEVRAAYLAGIPSGRFCTPEDVGELVAYLAAPGAAYVTGQAICINGGSILR